MRARFVPVLALATLACQQEPTVPKIGQDPVSITLSVSTQTMRVGDPDTITVVVTNNYGAEVQLFFPTICQVFITIRSQDGAIVAPRDGRPGCLAAPSRMRLPLGGSLTFTSIWTGGYDFNPPDTPAKVPPGSYFVSAALVASGYSTVAPAFKVDVQ
jgi:hypothetical protein